MHRDATDNNKSPNALKVVVCLALSRSGAWVALMMKRVVVARIAVAVPLRRRDWIESARRTMRRK